VTSPEKPESGSDAVIAITGITFASKYPEGGTEEGEEAKPEFGPPQGLDC